MRPILRWLMPLLLLGWMASPPAQEPSAGTGQSWSGTPVEVQLSDALAFVPSSLTIRQGETVVWVNKSRRTHTVTADPTRAQIPAHAQLPPGAKPFDSGDINPGQEYRHTFEVPGTYRYFCTPHELAGMVGTVVVEPAPGARQPR